MDFYNKPLNIERPLSPDDDDAAIFRETIYQDFIDDYDPEYEETEMEVGYLASDVCNLFQVLKHDKTGLAIKEVFEAAREAYAASQAKRHFSEMPFPFNFEAEEEEFIDRLNRIARYHELGKDNELQDQAA